MQDEGWEKWGWTHPKKRRRQVIQDDYIREVCKEFGVKRVDIGIIVAESAHLYFKGEKFAVGIDELEELKSKGTDLLIIEKEGIAEQLRHLADPYGVALVHTRGFLTEYAEELSDMVDKDGGNMAILTDFDISGIVIASKVHDVPRIGIDFDTLKDMGIYSREIVEKLEEEYAPEERHRIHFMGETQERSIKRKKLSEEEQNELIEIADYFEEHNDHKEYLKNKRIEINAVRKEVGSERFWNWILNKLDDEYPERDYNRAIPTTANSKFRPEELKELNDIVDDMIEEVVRPLKNEKKQELSEYLGFIDDVYKYRDDFDERLQEAVDMDEDIETFVADLEEIIRKHKQE